MSGVPSLTVFFPAFNEAENVDACIDETTRALDRLGIGVWEILFVDDGSRDATAARIEARSRIDPRIRLVRHPKNLGYGKAVLTGIAEARHAWFFMTDADLQFHPSELELLLPLTETHTFVQGWRTSRADRASRVALGNVYRGVVHALADVPVRDPECSFRLVRTDLLKGLEIRSRGPFVPVELTCRAARAGATFAEVGVTHRARARGESSALSLRSIGLLARDVARTLPSLRR